ncbi:MAG: 5-formyltetrahydrofolate cyclo-ligase [Verrucomicrobia bacterium]|nr:5-formyltetrahydrofolate cyclo-ligase [Verrucomicrobiota bacterium]
MTAIAVSDAKASLRAELRAQISTLPAEERLRATDRILDQLENLPEWQSARRVMLFAPAPGEPAIDRLWSLRGQRLAGKQVYYPRVNGDGLEVRHIVSPAELQIGRFGLREPNPERTEKCDPALLDLIVVPGLAFTAEGVRLGRGGGYFDRFLAQLPARIALIGVAFRLQLRPTLPEEAHDHRMTRVLVD